MTSDEKHLDQHPEAANDAALIDSGTEIPGAGLSPEQALEAARASWASRACSCMA